MNYTRNAVYSKVRSAILESYATAYITSRYIAKPSAFPSCFIHEIDRMRPVENIQLDFQDVQWESVFEIQIVSAKANTAASEAYGIMEVARQAFSDLYYREFSEVNIDSGDKFTLIGRFRRIIGGGDTMPTTNNS